MTQEHPETDSIPFYPDHVRTEFRVTLIVTGIFLAIGLVGLLSPLGIGDPADPMNTPAHVKPEWYFLALYQVLKFVPKTTGVIIPLVAVGLMFLWPFIDGKADKSRRATWIRLAVVIVGLIILIAMTIWGEVS